MEYFQSFSYKSISYFSNPVFKNMLQPFVLTERGVCLVLKINQKSEVIEITALGNFRKLMSLKNPFCISGFVVPIFSGFKHFTFFDQNLSFNLKQKICSVKLLVGNKMYTS